MCDPEKEIVSKKWLNLFTKKCADLAFAIPLERHCLMHSRRPSRDEEQGKCHETHVKRGRSGRCLCCTGCS